MTRPGRPPGRRRPAAADRRRRGGGDREAGHRRGRLVHGRRRLPAGGHRRCRRVGRRRVVRRRREQDGLGRLDRRGLVVADVVGRDGFGLGVGARFGGLAGRDDAGDRGGDDRVRRGRLRRLRRLAGLGRVGRLARSRGRGSRRVSPSERGALLVVAPGCRRSCAGAAGVESPAPSSKAANGFDGRPGSAAAARLRAVRSWFDGTLGGNATLGTGNLGSLDPLGALQSAGHPPGVPNFRDINGLTTVCGRPAGAAWAAPARRRQELPGRAGGAV